MLFDIIGNAVVAATVVDATVDVVVDVVEDDGGGDAVFSDVAASWFKAEMIFIFLIQSWQEVREKGMTLILPFS